MFDTAGAEVTGRVVGNAMPAAQARVQCRRHREAAGGFLVGAVRDRSSAAGAAAPEVCRLGSCMAQDRCSSAFRDPRTSTFSSRDPRSLTLWSAKQQERDI